MILINFVYDKKIDIVQQIRSHIVNIFGKKHVVGSEKLEPKSIFEETLFLNQILLIDVIT